MTLGPRYRALVYLTLFVSFLVVVWGGVVRVTGSGLGCPDWPTCHGQFLPSLDPATRIEWLHRFLGVAGGVTLAALGVTTILLHRDNRRVLALVVAAGVLYVLQAVLGAVVVLLELPDTWVTAHLANAELVLAVLTTLAVGVRWPSAIAPRRRSAPWTSLLLAGAVGTFVLLLTGAYVRGAGASMACTTWPLCDSGAFPLAGAPALHMAHRWVSGVVGVVVLAGCWQAWKHRREAEGLGPLAVVTAVVFVVQVAVGALNPLTGFSPWALGAHPAVASLLWCCVVAMTVVAWHPSAPSREMVSDLVALTKPSIMSLLLLTALGGMFLAERGVPSFTLLAATLVGGAAASGGASALNHYFDRDIDERMRRTKRRPLPSQRVADEWAIGMGIGLNVVAFAVLAIWTNVLAASLAIAGTLFYIFVYTLWLKRTTVQNIVIGGAAGAIPPLVGWAAVTGSLDLEAWLLFAIVFFWTPAHFWALALLIRDDYARAGVPMLPVVRGEEATTWGIFTYALSLVPLSLLLFVAGGLGLIYLAAAIALGVAFVVYAVRLLRAAVDRRRAMARGVYLYSLLYLALLFVAIMVDSSLKL
ncbi:MAG TPA: heme o synthase [Candidatus Limnocylindria bacterium]|nr:heme o synthase [Candidatus Limnocylindria bacterium]